jgi:hypothetical protein
MVLHGLALTVAGMAFTLGVEGQAADPPKEGALPAPQALVIPVVPGEGQIRVDRYAHWQAYQVDRFGQFRPLVIVPPSGHAYYYYNGAPFPWWEVYDKNNLRVRVGGQ